MSKDESARKLKASSFPYEVDYNDHFETPIEAYQDILPLLDLVAPAAAAETTKKKRGRGQQQQTKNIPRLEHVLYDPYYCDGRAAKLLHQLGFHNIQHKKCDFYNDIKCGTVPIHHTLVTNPPYSGNHKEKCVEYAVKNLRQDGKPFFLLMPNYVALKEYFRHAIADEEGKEPKDVVYIVPPASYQYDHPEGTGHDVPPFASIWFCGLGNVESKQAKAIYDRLLSKGTSSQKETGKRPPPRLVSTLEELKQIGAVPKAKRLNPKQRRKQRLKLQKASMDGCNGVKEGNSNASDENVTSQKAQKRKNKKRQQKSRPADESPLKSKKKSIYRDNNGVRKKRRF